MNKELQTRYDIFEPNDITALVCIEEPELQAIVFEQLGGLKYKIHTGLFGEDVTLKLRTHVYDAVVVHENFGGADLEYNQVLNEARNLPMSQRRKQIIVLVGPNMVTADEMQAFAYSVDLVVGTSDASNLRLVLRRCSLRHKDLYGRFMECLQEARMA